MLPVQETTRRSTVAAAGHWLWLDGTDDRCQTTLLARCRFELSAVPTTGQLRLTVNHLYRLYVNGTYLGRGPARSDPRWALFDVYDLTGLLVAGKNELLVLAHHFNWKPFEATGALNSGWRLYNGPGGLWAELEADKQPLPEPVLWEACLAEGWDDCPDRITRFLGYQHQADPTVFEPAMRRLLAGEGSEMSLPWQPMTSRSSSELGQPAERSTPALVETVRLPVRVSILKTSDAAVQNLPAVQREEHAQPIALADGFDTSLTFDFGRPMGGFPDLEIECAAGGAEIDLYMGEGGQSRRTDRLRCSSPGRWRYQPLDWRGGRTVTLQLRPRGGAVMVHAVRMIEMVYPFQPVGDFACSDPTLGELWQTCQRTAWAAMKDHPVDCLAREQALWIADVSIHARAILAAFGDMRPIEKALRQSLQVMHEDGVMPVPGPGALGYRRTEKSLPWSEQPLTVAMTLRDLYRYDGSLELPREAIGRLEAMYRLFERYEDARGLLALAPAGLPALMAFGGWNPFYKRGVPAALNFEYVQSLGAAAELAGAVNRPDLADSWRRRADRTRDAAVRLFWNPARKLFADAERDGVVMDAYSPTVNAWAALADAVPPQDRGGWAEALRSDPAVMPPVTPHDATLLLEAYARLGLDLCARALLDGYFGSIVRAGEPTLPEYWMAGEANGSSRGDDSSACHPYGAGPIYVLHEHVLGVTPLAPGFTTARIVPRSFGLTEARGRVPTPRGPIGIEWRRSDTAWGLQIELPAGVDAELQLPRLGWVRERLVVNGQIAWQTDGQTLYELQRERREMPAGSRVVTHRLPAGKRYHIELTTR